jgi:hypothetical protein
MASSDSASGQDVEQTVGKKGFRLFKTDKQIVEKEYVSSLSPLRSEGNGASQSRRITSDGVYANRYAVPIPVAQVSLLFLLPSLSRLASNVIFCFLQSLVSLSQYLNQDPVSA